MPDRVGKPPCRALNIGKDAVAVLVLEARKGVGEKSLVVHRVSFWVG